MHDLEPARAYELGQRARAVAVGRYGYRRITALLRQAGWVVNTKAKRAEEVEITAKMVLRELGKIDFANMADYLGIGENGDPFVDLSSLTRDQAAAIGEVTVEDFKDGRGEDARDVRRVKFKLNDKRAALVDIGRHLGMFTDKHEHSSPGGKPLEAAPAQVVVVTGIPRGPLDPKPDQAEEGGD